jgi:hypothetical protein
MRVSIHQPQYLPWLPYLLKIEACDLFVFLDTVDFQRNGLQNRNQVKTPQGANWLTVPIEQELGQKIIDTRTNNRIDWRRKHWQTLQQFYGKAAAFADHADALRAIYDQSWDGLCELNIATTRWLMRALDIATPCVRSSEMAAKGKASDLVLAICHEAGATSYLTGKGGLAYLQPDDFAAVGIELVFHDQPEIAPYPQQFPKQGFASDLSAIDIVLNCGQAWRSYLSKGLI